MRTIPLAGLAAALVAVMPFAASAGPKAKPKAPHQMIDSSPSAGGPTGKVSVCGVKVFPLALGNSWTYVMVPAPLPPDDQIKRISPAQAKQVDITVKSIDEGKKGADTVVTLEEKTTVDLTKDPKKPQLDERTITTTITCNAKKFEISPDSFFFSGEPGGYIGMKLDEVQHLKGTSWALTNGAIGEGEWREDLSAKWTRQPHEGSEAKLGTGKIELERRFTPQPQESISAKAGVYTAEKLGLITTGRVTLDTPTSPDTKPMELPANWVSVIWVAPGAGVIQTLNPYAQMYQLSAATLK
ncbi:MAG TPA: hypothetical protein VFQ65_22755 [Kofleriaceae bacterium]|nr:hypothetical protein [Kofleriaceae bacterium]